MAKKTIEKDFKGEVWKEYKITLKHVNKLKIMASNHGRIKLFNTKSDGVIAKGSMQSGYRILKLKLMSERDEKTAKKILLSRKQIAALEKKISNTKAQIKELGLKATKKSKVELSADIQSLKGIKKSYKDFYLASEKERTNYMSILFHRMVADCFCKMKSSKHNIVTHLDFNKTNNKVSNLKWVTQQECTDWQQKSPRVIAEKKTRFGRRFLESKGYKLTIPKVAMIKKHIKAGVQLQKLAEKYNVSATHIKRIATGENWNDIKAAK